MSVDICLFQVLCESLSLATVGTLERNQSFAAIRSSYIEALLDNSLIEQITLDGEKIVHAKTYDICQVGLVQMPC